MSNEDHSEQATPTPPSEPTDEQVRVTLFEAVGGLPYFETIVHAFFDRVEHDPVVRSVYPEDSDPATVHGVVPRTILGRAAWTYSEERGHPRLRARSLPVRDRSSRTRPGRVNMMDAIDATPLPASIFEAVRPMLENYIETAATAMITTPSYHLHPDAADVETTSRGVESAGSASVSFDQSVS